MNDRIQQLAEQAGITDNNLSDGNMSHTDLKKFARLIVLECIEVVEKQKAKMSYGPTFVIEDIKNHFGVEE
jgi:hypothetical protein